MLVSLRRTIKNGWKIFFRNFTLNTATVFIVSMIVFLLAVIFLFNRASDILISSIQDKVDISVYLKEDALDEDILEFKSTISKIPEVKDIEYVSRELALEKFIARHRDDSLLMESVAEVGDNPFLASLNIRAWQSSQYTQVVRFLEDSAFRGMVEKIDYYQRKSIIERVFSLTSGVNRAGIISSIILAVIAFLVAFNAIRIAINNYNEEVSVMRLVGASNRFIRAPFLVQGFMIGFSGFLIAFLLIYALCYFLDSKIKLIAPEISVFNLLISNLWVIILFQVVAGIGLGMISSAIAIRKYLKI